MKVSVIIPVWNDRAGLKRLLKQVLDYKIAEEIIICDDASDDDHSPESLGITSKSALKKIRYLRSPVNRGAGGMRNMGLEAAMADHVLFFDSDDLLAPGITEILAELEGKHFDFCIFKHHDSRVSGRRGTFESDEKYWRVIGSELASKKLNLSQSAQLVQLANYPWNKIYRRKFLTSQNIKCTEIPVHNDVELHWTSFIAATTIYCSGRIGAEHFVHAGGSRLTNRNSKDRLHLVKALRAAAERLHQTPNRSIYVEPLLSFCTRVIEWATQNIVPEHRGEMNRLCRQFLMEQFSRDDIVLTAYRNPAAAGKIIRLIGGVA